MKKIGGLFSRIVDRSNFSEAANLAAKGKRQRREVRIYFAHLDDNLARSIEHLRLGKLQFGNYRTFNVRDPKTRRIHAPPFADRVVHHALILATGATFEKGAIQHSYACRSGKGQHAALQQARCWSHCSDWYLKLDVEKFYDSVDHEHLKLLLRRRFREQRLLNLFSSLIDSYKFSPGKGLPIGALTSQYLGNFYLDPVDRWATQTMRCLRYARYMDDMVFWGSQIELRSIQQRIEPFLDTIGLRAKSSAQLNRCDTGLPFLGFIVYPNRFRLSARGKKRLRAKIRTLEKSYLVGTTTEIELQERGQALLAHATFADDGDWRRELAKFTLLRES